MESILLRLINTKLGNFVETVDAGALETNLLSGVIRLRNLRIKAEALASLKLPVKVVYGFVKDIKVEFSPMQVRTCAAVSLLLPPSRAAQPLPFPLSSLTLLSPRRAPLRLSLLLLLLLLLLSRADDEQAGQSNDRYDQRPRSARQRDARERVDAINEALTTCQLRNGARRGARAEAARRADGRRERRRPHVMAPAHLGQSARRGSERAHSLRGLPRL